MRIVVCVKAVPHEVAAVELEPDSRAVRCSCPRLHMNESDEYALEQALVLKRQMGAHIEVLCAGGTRHQDVLYLALAKGADAVTRLETEFGDDPHLTATVLAAAIRRQQCDLVLAGVESADMMAGQVGVTVAALLGLPSVSAVTGVHPRPDRSALHVVKELGGGNLEELEVSLPALLCVQSGIQPLSYAAAAKLLRARRQSIPSLSLRDLDLETEHLRRARLRWLRVFEPPTGPQAEIIQGETPTAIAAVLLHKVTEVCETGT